MKWTACQNFWLQVNVSGKISYIPGAEQLNDLPGVVQMSDIYRVSVPRIHTLRKVHIEPARAMLPSGARVPCGAG